jgi:nucleotide-binding universal stress UspA family protein
MSATVCGCRFCVIRARPLKAVRSLPTWLVGKAACRLSANAVDHQVTRAGSRPMPASPAHRLRGDVRCRRARLLTWHRSLPSLGADGCRWRPVGGRLVSSVVERKIIVGYDRSAGARDALVLGGLLGGLAGRQLLLAAFYDDDPVRYARAEDDRELHAYPDARLVLDQAPVGAEIERRVIHGRSPAAALSMLAEEQDAAAIVVGSARHAGRGFPVTGAVARQLFANSPCSVAAAPHGYRQRAPKRLARLLAAYVETDEGLDALRIAGLLAHAGQATLSVVSVVDTNAASVIPGRLRGDSLRAVRERALDAALRGLANTVAVDGVVLGGDPVACLLGQAACGVDLIITGSRSFGVVRQVALGSVSSRLVERSPVPVLVVPRGGDRDPVATALHPSATSCVRS